MDLSQSKLTKAEWESIEVPVSMSEKKIITMIVDGYANTHISFNNNQSLLDFMKIVPSGESEVQAIHQYIYRQYFSSAMNKQISKYLPDTKYTPIDKKTTTKKLRKADQMRINQNSMEVISEKKHVIYEYVLLSLSDKLLRYLYTNNDRYMLYYYTLTQIKTCDIVFPNMIVLEYIDYVLDMITPNINMLKLVTTSCKYIEKNEHLLQYKDVKLYDHQKRLFEIFKNKTNKSNLVLYIAPTATGKTLSPIGLSASHKIIFVCAARHVGLALAKSAIAVDKKIAFAFGCKCAEDIKLHYFAVTEFTKDRRSGGIRKVDNTVGDKVEIIVCDIKSYEYAMYYMLAFNDKNDIITFWDEPTITLDYDTHANHEHIQNAWSKNVIPNFVLSSATLPKKDEIYDVITDFKSKFTDINDLSDVPQVHTINSHDCTKTIPILNTRGWACLPHHIALTYDQFNQSINHCKQNLTLLRYFDLHEIDDFVLYVHKNNMIENRTYVSENYFDTVNDVNMKTVKMYYIDLCSQLTEAHFNQVKEYFQNSDNRVSRYRTNMKNENTSEKYLGTQLTTSDAYTLTDGPSIYMTNKQETIAHYLLQQLNIPATTIDDLMTNIQFNNTVATKIQKHENALEDIINATTSSTDTSGKIEQNRKVSDGRIGTTANQHQRDIDKLHNMLKSITIDDAWIPNTKRHCETWISKDIISDVINGHSRPFACQITEEDIMRIMEIPDVPNIWRILLVIGIGMFSEQVSSKYFELMKTFADEQKLYIIITNDDFIYGTNYQFCHGFIGKDLCGISQEKTIQAIGRVGRTGIQKDYSIRIRNDDVIKKIYFPTTHKPEVVNMNKLFVSE